jgi:hypothetical protein
VGLKIGAESVDAEGETPFRHDARRLMIPTKPNSTADRRNTRSLVTPFEIQGHIGSPGGGAKAADADDTGEALLIWNISDDGLCLWVASEFAAAALVDVTITKPWVMALRCEVRWCQAVPDRSGFLVGLMALDNLERLREIHTSVTAKTQAG